MTDTGDDRVPISNPVTGVSIYDVPGEDGVAEIRLAPGARGPAEHVHRTTEERFEVAAGAVTFRVDGRERQLGSGTEVRVSPGTPHAFRNETDAEAVLRVRTLPPNDRLGEVVATLFGLAHDGEVDEAGRPGLLQSAVMARETLEETYFADAPYELQRALGEVVGPVARALGYRPTYERYLSGEFWRERAVEDAPAPTATPEDGVDIPVTDAPGRDAGAARGREG